MHVFVHVIHSVMSDSLCRLPGSSVHGILQVRILEWVAILFSRDLLDPGIEPKSPALQADSLQSEPQLTYTVYPREPMMISLKQGLTFLVKGFVKGRVV